MFRFKTAMTLVAATIALGFALSALTPGRLLAQVRGALFVDADQPARQAVMIRRSASSALFETVYTVPAGKKLVIEQMNCSTFAGDAYFGILVGRYSFGSIVYSPPKVSVNAGVTIFDGQTRLYFEPGTPLSLDMYVFNDSTCTLSGYTVDATA